MGKTCKVISAWTSGKWQSADGDVPSQTMKKIFNFKKKKGSPSPSETASVLSASYDVKEKDLGKVHKAAFSGDVAKFRQLAKKNDLNQLDKENR